MKACYEQKFIAPEMNGGKRCVRMPDTIQLALSAICLFVASTAGKYFDMQRHTEQLLKVAVMGNGCTESMWELAATARNEGMLGFDWRKCKPDAGDVSQAEVLVERLVTAKRNQHIMSA